MQKFVRHLGAIALIGLGVCAWYFFFPSPQTVIRSRLDHLARDISFEAADGTLARAFKAEQAAGYFTLDAEVRVEIRGMEPLQFNGRQEIQQAILQGANSLRRFKVQFLDINVTLDPGRQTAKANLTGKWMTGGSRDFDVLEFNFLLKKVDGNWLIYRVESVKTLSLKNFFSA